MQAGSFATSFPVTFAVEVDLSTPAYGQGNRGLKSQRVTETEFEHRASLLETAISANAAPGAPDVQLLEAHCRAPFLRCWGSPPGLHAC